MLCSECKDQMYLQEVLVKEIDENNYVHIYVVSCENNHKIELEGDKLPKETGRPLLNKVIKYLLRNRKKK